MNDEQYRKRWAWIWGLWLGLVAASFAVLEAVAIFRRRKGDTLSEHLRDWLGIREGRRLSVGAIAFAVGLVAFVVWFVPHIVWGIW